MEGADMAALSAKQVKDLIARTQEKFSEIEHAQYDAVNHRYRMPETQMWQKAAQEAVPFLAREWREIIRVLAQGESYYGGQY
jgi:hypothetical protein